MTRGAADGGTGPRPDPSPPPSPPPEGDGPAGERSADAPAEVAAEVAAEIARRFRFLVEATATFVYTTDLTGRFVDRQRGWEHYTGQPWPEHRGDGWLVMVHPEDRAAVHPDRRGNRALAPYEVPVRLWSAASLEWRHCLTRGAPITDRHGRFVEWLGAVQDIEDRLLEQQRLQDELEATRGEMAKLVEADIVGMMRGEEERIVDANGALLAMLGYTAEDVATGRLTWPAITPPGWEEADRRAEHACRVHGRAEPYEKAYLHREGHVVPVILGGVRLAEDPFRWLFVVVDISARVSAEQAADRARAEAEAAGRRLAVLNEVGERFSRSLDPDVIADELAAAVVPRLADWCSVRLLDDAGNLADGPIVHADPGQVELVRTILERYPPESDGDLAEIAMSTGEAQVVGTVPDELLVETAVDGEHLEMLRALRLGTVVQLPLMAGERPLGVISFATEAGRSWGADDLATAQGIGDRAALALDNARLYGHQAHIARTLQHSLLPEALPDVEGLDIAARYWVAGTGAEVGGDFYDVVRVHDDPHPAVFIGDVCGKGVSAAATTALARHTLRAAAQHAGGVVEALRWLHDAMLDEHSSAFTTALFGRLLRLERGYRFEFALAGHPPPLVVRASGRVSPVGTPGTPAGAPVGLEVHLSTVDLEPGDALVLYTDGVTDAPGEAAVDQGELCRIMVGAAGRSADEITEHLRAALASRRPHEARSDDTALVVLRVMEAT
ncbi:MAG: SpoIIE family protein phosphatase [Actinobacteria bacterium]|nr:SpoIIE family protein phosphatase [Actinomycetota bacterium]